MINKEKLYQTAYAFKNENLWRLLTDEQIFAVQHEDGTISYYLRCSMRMAPSATVQCWESLGKIMP